MVKLRHKSLEEWIFTLYIILMPILPEYFRVGGSPFFVYLGALPLLALLIHRNQLKISKTYVRYILPLLILSIICFMAHGEYSSLARYLMFPILSTFIIQKFSKDEKTIYNALYTLILVGLVMCFLGLIERLFNFNVFSVIENVADYGKGGTQPSYRNGVARVELSFGNAISAALYLLFINCIAFTLMRSEEITSKRKKVCAVTYILSFILIILTDSRLCLMTAAIMQVMFLMRERWSKRAAIVVAGISIVLIDFAIGGFITQFLGKYIGLIADILKSGSNTSDMNTLYRFQLIPTFIPMIKDRFLFGYGNEFLNGYRFAILNGYSGSIDNMYLETFVRHGLFGFLIVIIPIFEFIYISGKLKKIGKKELGYNFNWMLIIYLINLVSVAQLSEQRLFYILFGLAFSLMNLKNQNGEAYYIR